MHTGSAGSMRQLRGVGKRYRPGGPWVLDGVDLELRPGRLVRIVGGNGSGKSTLLRLVAGVGRPTRGRVVGRAVIGYVPERFPPALPFTALDYLVHLGRVHGLATGPARSRGGELLDALGAAGFAGTALRELSKGTAQKVAVAQALLPRPGLLVLDEAWTGLDVAARALLDAYVDERLAAGAAVLFVDHDPSRLAGRSALALALDGGRLVPAAIPGAGVMGGSVAVELSGLPADPDRVAELLGVRDGVVLTGAVVDAEVLDGAVLDGAVLDGAVLDGAGGVLRLRVPAAAVDDVLRRALAAGPAVHVHRVTPADDPDGGPR